MNWIYFFIGVIVGGAGIGLTALVFFLGFIETFVKSYTLKEKDRTRDLPA